MRHAPIQDEKHKRMVTTIRVLAVVAGASLFLLGILGMLHTIAIGQEGSLFFIVLGVLAMLTGILRIWLLDFLPW